MSHIYMSRIILGECTSRGEHVCVCVCVCLYMSCKSYLNEWILHVTYGRVTSLSVTFAPANTLETGSSAIRCPHLYHARTNYAWTSHAKFWRVTSHFTYECTSHVTLWTSHSILPQVLSLVSYRDGSWMNESRHVWASHITLCIWIKELRHILPTHIILHKFSHSYHTGTNHEWVIHSTYGRGTSQSTHELKSHVTYWRLASYPTSSLTRIIQGRSTK